MNKDNKIKILIGITGGIAAYKTIEIARLLQTKNFNVHIAMTPSSTEFIKPLTFEAITNNPVQIDLFPNKNNCEKNDLFPHLYPASQCSYFAVIPATANMIAKLAYGLADEIVSTCALALPQKAKRFFCPAMNVNMWNNQIVKENVAKLNSNGWIQIGPIEGLQACGDYGFGKLADTKDIVDTILELNENEFKLNNKSILILSGPTREYIDPVRFISNASSGKMGKALADKAVSLGANVTFISGQVSHENLPKNKSIKIINVISTDEMLKQAAEEFKNADIIIFAAAVSDYAPEKFSNEKIKSQSDNQSLLLKPTVDIAATLCKNKSKNQLCIGFALETNNGKDNALKKLKNKNLDCIILNSPSSLNANSGEFTFLNNLENSKIQEWGILSKMSCAEKLFNFIINKVK